MSLCFWIFAFTKRCGRSARAHGISTISDEIENSLQEEKTILVKGSRFMRMERVVALLTGEKGAVH